MATTLPKVSTGPFRGMFAALLVATGLLGGCDGGGSSPTTVYFSMSDYEGCATAYVRLLLETVGTELAVRDDGSPDCVLAPELSGAGCSLHLTESPDGRSLMAAISGCRVPVVSKLFSCQYVHADLSALNTESAASCGCLSYDHSCYVNGICDLCASRDPEGRNCESCDNRIDDDGDHKVDCDDPDCELTEVCGFGRSTISCPRESSTTITTTSTTNPASSVSEDPPAPMTSQFERD